MGWRDYDARPYNATGRIAGVLAENYGTHPSSASDQEADY
jgi:hypothetical protein